MQLTTTGALLRRARCFWEPELPADSAPDRLARLELELERKRGFLQSHVNAYLSQKRHSKLEFVSVTAAAPTAHAAQLKAALEKVGPLTAPDLVRLLPPDDERLSRSILEQSDEDERRSRE